MQYPKLRVDLFAKMQLLIFSFHLKKLVKVHIDQNRVHTVLSYNMLYLYCMKFSRDINFAIVRFAFSLHSNFVIL